MAEQAEASGPLAAVANQFEKQQELNTSLKDQLGLLELAKKEGIDASRFLQDLTFGAEADDLDFAKAQTAILAEINKGAEKELLTRISFGDLFEDLARGKNPISEIFEKVSVGGPASKIASTFQDTVFGPLRTQVAALDQDFLEAKESLIFAGPDAEKTEALKSTLSEINADRLKTVQEVEAAQKRILAIQEKQSQLDFLKQQQDLLKLIEDNGLAAEEILGGLTLGLDADPTALLGGMERALTAIVGQTNAMLKGAELVAPLSLEEIAAQTAATEAAQKALADRQQGEEDFFAFLNSEGALPLTDLGQQFADQLSATLSNPVTAPPASATQIASAGTTTTTNNTTNVDYTNNSGAPLADVAELNFLMASYR